MKIWPGKPYPLGATWDGAGVNFSLFSENATKVELCLVRCRASAAETRIRMTRADASGLACLSARSAAGTALRLSGARTLRAAERSSIQSGQAALGSLRQGDRRRSSVERRVVRLHDRPSRCRIFRATIKTAPPGMPKCVVVDPAFSWGNDAPPDTPLAQDDYLRIACERFHHASSGGAAGIARHLRRADVSGR